MQRLCVEADDGEGDIMAFALLPVVVISLIVVILLIFLINQNR